MKFSHLNRVYTTHSIIKDQTLTFQGEHFHYLKSVLRLKKSDYFRIFNEKGGEFLVQVLAITRNDLIVKVGNKIRKATSEKELILGMCIIKPDRMSEAIKAAVQLGATKIIPIISERTQYNKINIERVGKCIIEATEQSERLKLPGLHLVISLKDFCNMKTIDQIIFANEEELEEKQIKDIKNFKQKLAVLVGPEGGFSSEEKEKIISCKIVESISLGPTVLRSEIAVSAILSCVTMMRN